MQGKTVRTSPSLVLVQNLSELFFSCVHGSRSTTHSTMYCGVCFFLIKKYYGKQKRGGGGVQAKVVVKILKLLVYKSVLKNWVQDKLLFDAS